MFNSIAWSAYFECIVFLLLAYYGIVLLLYFRKDIYLRFVQLQRLRITNDHVFSGQESAWEKPLADKTPLSNKDRQHPDKGGLANTVYDLLDELNVIFKYAANKKINKQELLFALQRKLANYPQLKGSDFQTAIEDHIVEQAVMQCEMVLEEDDIKKVW